MFEMTLILAAVTIVGIMAYDYSLNTTVENDWGEKAKRFF